MKTVRQVAAVLALVLIAGVVSAQERGQGRLMGKVLDEQGQPLADVVVKATSATATEPRQAKTNKKGEWNLAALTNGEWTLEFSLSGFDTQSGKVQVQGDKAQGVTVTMPKHVDRVDPAVELNAEAQKGLALISEQKYAEARAVFEALMTKYPDVHQLNAYVAQTYAAENNLDKAVEYMKIAVDHDPANAEMKLVLGDLMMEKGDRAAAVELMRSVDITQIKNPMPLINASITLINEKKLDEALSMLNKIAQQFPSQPETYYYRARAYIAAEKMPEAKADLEKFVSLAPPDARELPEAKKILDQMKDVK
jgi:predicted Zn-dependent protease